MQRNLSSKALYTGKVNNDYLHDMLSDLTSKVNKIAV